MVDNQRAILQSIADDLRCCLPLEAIFPTETRAIQKVCSFLVVFRMMLLMRIITIVTILTSQLAPKVHFALQTQENPRPTLHVDSFLYDEEMVDNLCDEGKMSRNFCLTCGSHRTAPMGNFTLFIIWMGLFLVQASC